MNTKPDTSAAEAEQSRLLAAIRETKQKLSVATPGRLSPAAAKALGELRDQLAAMEVLLVPRAFACPICAFVSYNLGDIVHSYCGRCHVFVDDLDPQTLARMRDDFRSRAT